MSEVFLPGPAGKIHGSYVKGERSMVALVLPPHPKQGGTMNNRTVYALSRAFINSGFSTLRINFRGVCKSEGDFGNNFDDEFLRDASAAINWLQERNPVVSEFWVAGFSFGAWMAMNLVMRRPETTGFLAVSPPVERYDFSFIFPCTIPGLIIQGGDDKFNNPDEVGKLASKLIHKARGIKYKVIEGADYKYSDVRHLEQVYGCSRSYLKSVLENGQSFAADPSYAAADDARSDSDYVGDDAVLEEESA